MAKRLFVFQDAIMEEIDLDETLTEGDWIAEVVVVRKFKVKSDKDGKLKIPGGKKS